MKSPLESIAASQPIQVLIALVIYSFYALVLGLSASPAIGLLLAAWRAIAPLATAPEVWKTLLLGVSSGAAYFLFLITSTLVMGSLIRVLSLGIGPGRYPKVSLTMLRWLLYSGIYTLAYRLVLPIIPVSWFSNLFFMLAGCRMGKNVYLNSYILNDAHLIELGDDVTIGGGAEISCHLYEDDCLILDRVRIGSGTLIGANAYVSPGADIGKNCLVGLGAYVRRGATLADGSRRTCLGAISLGRAASLERAPLSGRSGRDGEGLSRK
ncbi:MAG: DapH/DapD/GlmU-related protein [Spirochaetota bacterium]